MTNFELAKRNYDRGLWSEEMLRKLVYKNKLTATELNLILNVQEEEKPSI